MLNWPGPPAPYDNVLDYFWLLDWIASIRDWLGDLSHDIQNVYLLGDWLSYPFGIIANFVGSAHNTAWSVLVVANNLTGWVAYYFFGGGLEEHIASSFPGLFEFLASPVETILGWFFEIYDWIYDFFNDPYLFIAAIAGEIVQDVQDIIANPEQFVLDTLNFLFPNLIPFWSDPIQFILDGLSAWYSFIPSFLLDPLIWLDGLLSDYIPHWGFFVFSPANWIVDLLSFGFGFISDFFLDPYGFVGDVVNFILSELDFNPLGLGPTLVDKLLDITRDWLFQFLDKITELIIDIILENI